VIQRAISRCSLVGRAPMYHTNLTLTELLAWATQNCDVLYPAGLPPHGEGLKSNRIAMGGTDVAFPAASLPVALTV
jgi:hypothetical protein